MMFAKRMLFLLVCSVPIFSAAAADSLMEAQYRNFAYPPAIPAEIRANIGSNTAAFLADLKQTLAAEKENLLVLVDKQHFLPEGYSPKQLMRLNTRRAYLINRNDLSLTKTAEQALQEMALAAKQDGVTLIVSSTYRSYAYQKNLFDRAGTSQHQLGTVVDFGSISDEFAATRAGKWVLRNASRYGWSLSFPKGYEKVTGYVWESWHYRYIGTEACRFQQKWFGDIQQYMLEFIDAWKKQTR